MSRFFGALQRATTEAAPIKLLVLIFLTSLVVLTLAYQFPAFASIDVGSGTDTPFIHGFSFRENLPDGSNIRWSGAHAEILFPGLGAQEGTLTLRLAAPRPTNPARVQVWANGHKLEDIQPGSAFQEFKFWIDRKIFDVSGNLLVTLQSDIFTQPPDTRELGLQIDFARFQWGDGLVVPYPDILYLVALVLLAFIVARAWSGNVRVAIVSSALTMLLLAWGVAAARVQTMWLAAPLFWFGLLLFAGALALAHLLQRWDPELAPTTLRALFAAMAFAFAVRMIWATGPGFIVDVQDYVVWSYKTATYGLGTAYTAIDGLWIADQSPGIVYLLHVLGLIYRTVFSPDFLYPGIAGDPSLRALTTNPAMLADPVQRTLLRMPSLFADVIAGALIFTVARDKLSARGAWLVALGYWFNPAVLWNGAYWGQMDAVHSLLVLSAFLLLDTKHIGASFFVLGLGALTKPQAAIFGPLLLLWAYREGNWRGVVRATLAGAFGAGLMLAPMLLLGSLDGMLAYFADTVGHHPILSANAHNLWWFLQAGQIDVPDTKQIISGGPVTFRLFSLMLFGAFYLATLARARISRRTDYFAFGASVAFAFFMLPTEIHENYGYALLPLLAVAMTRDRNWLAFYIVVTVTMVINYALSDPPLFARFGIDDPVTELAALRFLNSAANVVLFVAWSSYLFARRRAVFQPSTEPRGVTR